MSNMQTEARLVAELNDLLQLDHDAVQAYSLAMQGLRNSVHVETLRRFRSDHERHIQELTELIEAHGGIPIQLSHIPTGPMKLAVQGIGNLGSEREVLLAFRANERQVRDKYHRFADGANMPDVAELLHRNAADEDKHFRWVTQVLEQMGVSPDSGIGQTEQMFENVHGRMADMIEGAERVAMVGGERVRRFPVPAMVMGVAAVFLIRRIFR
jgi:rubrerythrin